MSSITASAKRQFLIGLIGMSLLLFAGWYLFQYVSETGFLGLLHPTKTNLSTISLKAQPVYTIKTKQQILGIEVIRIISKQQPEEFLVLNQVPRTLVDSMFGKQMNLAWANTVANQFVKLRQTSEDSSSPVSIDIQRVQTLKSGTLKKNGQQLPFWQIEICFKLSNEAAPRFYSVGIVRQIQSTEPNNKTEALVVEYAQKEAYQPELVTDLMDHLRFMQN